MKEEGKKANGTFFRGEILVWLIMELNLGGDVGWERRPPQLWLRTRRLGDEDR